MKTTKPNVTDQNKVMWGILRLISLLSRHPRLRHTFFKRFIPLLPAQVRTPTLELHGFRICLDLMEELDYSYAEGFYDREELEFLVETYENNSYFADIGANIGFYSLFLKHKLPQAKIIAFEPDPVNIVKLKRNIALNGYADVAICEYALSTDNKSKQLMININRNRGGNSLLQPQKTFNKSDTEVTVDVECKTLFDALKENAVKKVSALKIDIEGFEYPVLKKFFEEADRDLFPEAVVMEAFGNNISAAGGSSIELMILNGYKLVNHDARCNYFFQLK
jgi:FkbM family methyltransferase